MSSEVFAGYLLVVALLIVSAGVGLIASTVRGRKIREEQLHETNRLRQAMAEENWVTHLGPHPDAGGKSCDQTNE